MAPIQKDATGTHIGVMVGAQVVLVLTVVAIVLLNVISVIIMGELFPQIKEKTTATENVGGVHKTRGALMIGGLPNVGLALIE